MISYRRGHKKTVYNKIPISFMKCKRVRGFSRRFNQQELRYLFIFKKTQGVYQWILKEFTNLFHCLLLFPYQATFSLASTLSQLRINCANYKTVHLKSFPITSTINININIIIIVIMIACDNFCYFVALAWRLLANGLLIFNLPHTVLKICFCSFPYFTSTFHYSHQLQATEYTSVCVCWPRSHLCDWQSLIFALKLKNFHHFSICCCRTCKRNSQPAPNSLSNSLIKHTDLLHALSCLSVCLPYAHM